MYKIISLAWGFWESSYFLK